MIFPLFQLRCWIIVIIGLQGISELQASPTSRLSAASFACDVTPPLGHPLCGGWIKPLVAVDDPLLAKGVILNDGKDRYVLCAVDWCLLQTGAFDQFRQAIALGAGVPVNHVSVHTLHQHNAPIADSSAQKLLDQTSAAPLHLDLQFMKAVCERVGASVRAACTELKPVSHVGYGKAKVEGFASNRRVRLPDGEIHVRYSSTTNPVLRAAPEGLIDPWLRSVTLFNQDEPLVRLHFYATHPQSYYGDGRATSDTVGLARERFEREEGFPQIYFTGCGGNITAGKYNNGSAEARIELTGKLFKALQTSSASTTKTEIQQLGWKNAAVKFEPREEMRWSLETAEQTIADTKASSQARLIAALDLAWLNRLKANPQVDLACLSLGPVKILMLPGESFIEYQLYAQNIRPNDFVAVAAYGEGGTGYICTDAALSEGGYEPTMSRVGPPSEFRLKHGIAKLLGSKKSPAAIPFYSDKLRLLAWRDRKGFEHPIKTQKEWAKRRENIPLSMLQVMGEPPKSKGNVPLDVEIIEEVSLPSYIRQKITFATESNDRVPAYLLIPHHITNKVAAMLCLHQTTPLGKGEPVGLGGNTNLHYAHELAEQGYIALVPDYPNYGEYTIDPYARGYASATMKGIWNHRRAVDLLTSMRQVDKNRIGVIGHSLGGHNALFVAAFDPRIKTVITSCGFNSFFRYRGGDLTGWSHSGYMPRIKSLYGLDPKAMPFDFSEVLAALAPRRVFISAPMHDDNFDVAGVKDCVAAAAPVYQLFKRANNLTVLYPNCGHDFPPELRHAAYDWLRSSL